MRYRAYKKSITREILSSKNILSGRGVVYEI